MAWPSGSPEIRALWTLDGSVTFLNHGSFGATPRPVLDERARLRAEMEREPVLFLGRRHAGSFGAAGPRGAPFPGGATPRPVLDEQARLRAEMEREPVLFLGRRHDEMFGAARARVAAFLGADPRGLVAVPNASTGVNTVLRSLEWSEGDEIVLADHA